MASPLARSLRLPTIGLMMRWLLLVVLGLFLNGSGLSLLGWAAYQKFSACGEWFWSGTLALVLCNAGICCLVGAKKPEGRSS